jgi:AraC-like DNA-binding protein
MPASHAAPSRTNWREDRPSSRSWPSKLSTFRGSEIEFNAKADEITFVSVGGDIPVVSADPYLNELLIAFCEQAMDRRPIKRGTFEATLENVVAPLLPHGRLGTSETARQLGVSPRTFARRLASEGLTLMKLLDHLREQLAREYLADPTLPISEIAWLLGYRR